MPSNFAIPAPETDFLDPRTGKISVLWYQYLFQLNRDTVNTTTIINSSGLSRTGVSSILTDGAEQGEQGPRGLPGRNGKDGVTRIVHVYLPADENEPMTVYRKR